MIIACLGEKRTAFLPQHDVHFFSSLETLLEKPNKWDAILLDHAEMSQNDRALTGIRRHELFALIPVFTVALTPLTPLCDGSCDSEIAVTEKITRITQRLGAMKIIPSDGKSQFLAYCYSRAPLTLTSEMNWHASTYYYYPLVELFIEQTAQIPRWLNELTRKNLLSKGELIHTHFSCAHCDSAHLSFTERCPNCHHENIAACPFMHCFTCGLMAPEAEFIQAGRLKCPKCESPLRHVGEDYDRPLESGQCFNCHEYYQEVQLWVRCMMCAKDYAPEQLGKDYYCVYHVSESNAMDILNTYFIQNLQVFDDIHYIESPFFMTLLNWLFSINQRYPEEAFGLIGLKLTLSAIATPYLSAFAEQFKTILRQTDIFTRIMDDEIWVLLPKTDEAGVNNVLSRINETKSSFPEAINWKIAGICSAQMPNDITMENMIIMLRTNEL